MRGHNKMVAYWQVIKAVCTHGGLLIFVLLAAFFAFAFHPGSLGDIMRLGYVLFIVHFSTGSDHFRALTRGHLVMIAVILIVLSLNFIVPSEQIHSSTLSYFLAIPGLVLICHLLACSLDERPLQYLEVFALGAMIIGVSGHLLASFFLDDSSHGLYNNMHHLGLFASVCILPAGYFALVFKKWGRLAATLLGLSALYLLWESSSRVSWLAFFVSAIFTAMIMPNKKHLVLIVMVGAGAALMTGAISGFHDIGIRVDDLWAGWRTEERVYIWSDTFGLMQRNSPLDWLRGHGIGSFRYFIQDFNGLSIEKLEALPTFPHNLFFQVLFENGILGFIVIFGSLGGFVRNLWRGIRRPSSNSTRHLYVLCFSTFWILFIHTFLTKSVYSNYIAYLFSLTLGIALALDMRSGQTKTLTQLFPNAFSEAPSS